MVVSNLYQMVGGVCLLVSKVYQKVGVSVPLAMLWQTILESYRDPSYPGW